jgi:cytochrome c-type biogenesis protein CcmH
VTTFVIVGAAMVLAALATVLVPLLKADASGIRRWPAALIIGTAVPVLALALYGAWSNWRWNGVEQHDGVPPAIAPMLASLEARLEANPTDVSGWLLLGRSYFQLQRYYQAADAYQQAYTLTQGKDVESVLGLGEALAFVDERMLTGRSAELFERGLELAPQHPKALWYSGLVAYQMQRYDVARQRWAALVALEPPAAVKQALEAKIAEIDAAIGGAPPRRDRESPRGHCPRAQEQDAGRRSFVRHGACRRRRRSASGGNAARQRTVAVADRAQRSRCDGRRAGNLVGIAGYRGGARGAIRRPAGAERRSGRAGGL